MPLRTKIAQVRFKNTSELANVGSIENLSLKVLHVLTPEMDDTPEITENNLKSLETLWIDRLKCEYLQGLNWARYDPVSRHQFYKSTTQ